MDLFVYSRAFLTTVLVIAIGVFTVKRLIRTNEPLHRHFFFICISALASALITWYRVIELDEMLAYTDGFSHNIASQAISDKLAFSNLFDTLMEVKPGNSFYQHFVGVIYWIVGPYPEVIFVGSGYLGFIAMVYVLDGLCHEFPNLPWFGAMMVLMLPTVLFWSSFNLKESPALWSIAVLLRSSILGKRGARLPSPPILLAAFLGLLLRPHIVICWLAGVMFTRFFNNFNVITAASLLLVMFLGIQLVDILIPGIKSDFGVTVANAGAASERHAVSHGGSAIFGRPVMFMTGLTLLLFRPYPWEIFSVTSLATALEIWAITLTGIIGWFFCQDRVKLLVKPLVLTSAVALCCLFVPFSYFYNMGLLARQRLQAFPAIVVLAAAPFAARGSRSSSQIMNKPKIT